MSEEHTHERFERLVALVDGQLSQKERATVERHIASCQRCAADVAWLRRVGELVQGGMPEAPPRSASARVRALYRARRRPATRTIHAALRFDSSAALRPVGLRSAAVSERQLIYSAPPYDVDLRVTPQDTRFAVAGQVLGPETAGYVTVIGAAGEQFVTLSTECEFALPLLDAGSYRLSLRLGDAELIIGELTLAI